MKRSIYFLLATLWLMSCGNGETTQNNEITEKSSFDHYLSIKDALVETDMAKAKSSAEAYLQVVDQDEVKRSLNAIIAAEDVAGQRVAFEALSEQMYTIVKMENPGMTVYRQYCPMAFNNQGAHWLSKEEKIMNPYFGDVMLNCGRIDETLNMP